MPLQPLVGVVMGSRSDWGQMQAVSEILEQLQIPYLERVVSAHRTPELVKEFAKNAARQGVEVFICGAGGAAHLPGMFAAHTDRTVIGVPIRSSSGDVLNALLSIVDMPKGIPVGAMSTGSGGPANAALYAASILGIAHPDIRARLIGFRRTQTQDVLDNPNPRPDGAPAGAFKVEMGAA